jgi:hypothetical protein
MKPGTRVVVAVLFIALSSAPGLADYVAEVSADNPVAWWRFEDASSANGSTAFDTAGPFDGVYLGDIQLRGGIAGQAARLDGNLDYVSVGAMGTLPQQGTIEMWILPEAVENYRNPFTTGPLDGLTGNQAIRFEELSGGGFRVVVSDTSGSAPDYLEFLALDMVPDSWYHVVLTWDTVSGLVNGYLNGNRVITDSSNTFWPSQLTDVTIGVGYILDPERCWLGRIDEVAIYDTALPADRVEAHHAAAVTPYVEAVLADNPTAWWRFEDPSSTSFETAFDFLGTNDGTYSGDVQQQTGIAGNAARFDGNLDYVSIGAMGALPHQGSIEMWILPEAVENYRNPFTTGPLDGLTGNQAIRFEELSSGGFRVVISDDSGSTPDYMEWLSLDLQPGSWYHLVLTWDTVAGLVNGYLNGNRVITDASNSFWPSQLTDVTIGVGYIAHPERCWLGRIDEVAIYDAQLSPGRVQAHHDGATPIFVDGFESGDTSAWSSSAP